MLDQSRTPLLDAIKKFQEEDPAYFRIPGHRFDRGADEKARKLLGRKAFCADLTEAEGLDDLHQPEGVIYQAEALAADLFGSDCCWFLVNGTTCGNETMILASVREGEKILVPRNAHKSVLMGLVLSGAIPVWMQPEYLESWDISGTVHPETVEQALEQDPEIRAVFLVSPTYYGICSDIRRIAEICHVHGVPLLVDEAHGSHLYFSESCPGGAAALGADLCSQSTHKTLGSLTQSSMLHWKSSLVSRNRVEESLKLVMSTSPSYLLMASLDGARHQMAEEGKKLVLQAENLAEKARELLREIPGISVLTEENAHSRGKICLDPLRVVFRAESPRIRGYQLQDRLFAEGQVSTELADENNVVAVITWGNTEEDIRRLTEAADEIVSMTPDITGNSYQTAEERQIYSFRIPEQVMTPRRAWMSQSKACYLEMAEGQICAESVIPYPPGIPILYPGERVTKEAAEAVQFCREHRLHLHGCADTTLRTLQVVTCYEGKEGGKLG